jgi:hypothetical protein
VAAVVFINVSDIVPLPDVATFDIPVTAALLHVITVPGVLLSGTNVNNVPEQTQSTVSTINEGISIATSAARSVHSTGTRFPSKPNIAKALVILQL